MARNSANTEDHLEEETAKPPKTRRRSSTSQRSGNGSGGSNGGGGLERVTVNLIPRASRALEQSCALTGDSKTDTINRALQVYAYLEEVWANDGSILTKLGDNVTELKFF